MTRITSLLLSSSSLSFVFFSLLYFLPTPVAAVDCFYPDGSVADQVAPCSSAGGTCCPLGWECLSNGLCAYPPDNYLGRYSCTDQTWGSSSCPQICTEQNTATGDEAILKCANGDYCCDGNRSWNCCNTTGTNFFSLPEGKVLTSITTTYTPTSAKTVSNPPPSTSDDVPINPTTTTRPLSSSSPTRTVTTHSVTTGLNGDVRTIIIVSTAYAPQPTSSTQSSSSSKSGLTIGLALGIPLALLLLAAIPITTFLCLRRRRRQFSPSADEKISSVSAYYYNDDNDASHRRRRHRRWRQTQRHSTITVNSTSSFIEANYQDLAPGSHAPELDGWPVAVDRQGCVAGEKTELVGDSSVYAGSSLSPGVGRTERDGSVAWPPPVYSPMGTRGGSMGASWRAVRSPGAGEAAVELWAGEVRLPLGTERGRRNVGNGNERIDEEEEEEEEEDEDEEDEKSTDSSSFSKL